MTKSRCNEKKKTTVDVQRQTVREKVMQTEPYIKKEKFGLFVDFEFLTEMGSWGTD